jgi:mono/diheme cytochrome c family protein
MSRTDDERRARRLARMRARALGGNRRSDLLLRQMIDDAEDETEAAGIGLFSRVSRKLGAKGRFLAIAVLIGVSMTVASIYYDRHMVATAVRADWQDPALVSEGRTAYRDNCAFCHGEALEGQAGWDGTYASGHRPALPLDGSAPIWRLSDDDIFDVIKYGGQPFSPSDYRNDMPGFELQISDARIWALVAYLKSRWSEETRQRQEEAAAERNAGG